MLNAIGIKKRGNIADYELPVGDGRLVVTAVVVVKEIDGRHAGP